jgi:hypothetical protein
MTYTLEVERQGNLSDRRCDCKTRADDIQPAVGEGGQHIRLQ